MKDLELFSDKCLKQLHKNNLLKPLIRSELIRNILSEINIETKTKEKVISDFCERLNISDNAKLNEWLEENKLDKTNFEELALTNVRLKEYLKLNFEHQVASRFLDRKNDLDIVVYSIIRVKDFFLARELFFRVQEEEASFGDIATKHSEGIENKTRGLIGPAPLARAHPKLVELIKKSKIGEINSPIQIDEFHIVLRLEYFEPAKLDSFMKEKMSEELFNNWIDQETDIINNNLLEKILVSNPESNLVKIS